MAENMSWQKIKLENDIFIQCLVFTVFSGVQPVGYLLI